MLTKELLQVTKRKPYIQPRFRAIADYRELAASVIEIYVGGATAGRTRGEIETAVADLETHDTFKLVRGLSTLLDRRATFEQQAPVPPATLREAAFERGFVVDEEERQEVIAAVGAEHDLSAIQVEDALWADRDENEVLVEPPDIDPDALLRQYNLSLAQTLLFDAVELEFTVSGNYQELFRLLGQLGLMYLVDEDLAVTVTGPASLFRRTRRYGTRVAKLLPAILQADEWEINADIETEVSGETRIYEFAMDSTEADRFPDQQAKVSYDSDLERDFAARIANLADGWTVNREPTILRAGNRVMIPDFSFVRDRGDGDPAFYLEIVGFWTPEYLAEKITKVRQLEATHPLVLAVDATLNCTEETFADTEVDQVIMYEGSIPVKPVLSRLKSIDERHVEHDRQRIEAEGIPVPSREVVAIADLAAEHGYEPSAIRRHLAETAPGAISNDRYVPPAVLTTIRAAVDELDAPTLADVSPILDEYDVAPSLLEEIGYTIDFSSLSRTDARVRRIE